MVNNRYISDIIEELSFKYGKMAFVSGPRQVGKTTLAQSLLTHRRSGEYHNWDDKAFRKMWVKGPKQVAASVLDSKNPSFAYKPLLILDELHKDKRWKSSLKGLFDLFHKDIDILVTGSARLNIFKKGGDSLLGRYFSFRLHPLSLAELIGHRNDSPSTLLESLFKSTRLPDEKNSVEIFTRLMTFGGFPDPYLNGDHRFANLWRSGRIEKLVREDLRDLSRLPELSQVELLATLLPDKVGNPLSVQSLCEDVEVSHNTVTRWMKYLENLYYHFTIRPYSKRVIRSLKKEPKIYLYDWSEIDAIGPRFENLVASHLMKACHFWHDSGHGLWQLHYLRNKEKKEVDFLLTLKDKAILSIECKHVDTSFDPSVLSFAKQIGLKYHIQLVAQPGFWQKKKIDGIEVLIASADSVLSQLV